MKKFLALFLSVFMLITVWLTTSGCASKDGIIDDKNTLNIRIRKAGYGTTYISALADQFEKTFESQGYKVNILPAQEDLVSDKVGREIYSGSKIDLFFADSFLPEFLEEGDYGIIGSDLTESVWSKKAIKFDGTEEEQTIAEKLSVFDTQGWFYNSKIRGLPYACSIGGLAVNTKVLEDYGLETPRTTDELFQCAEEIMKHAAEDEIYPFTYAFQDNLYINRVAAPWIAQYNGIEEFNEFFSWSKADGTAMGADSYKVFGYESVRKMLEVVYQFYDWRMMSFGSDSHDVSAAQGQIMKGEAVFYAVGDWMFQEECAKYPQYLNDVTLIPAPMISALGEKMFGEGSSYGFNKEKADDVLSLISKYAMQGKLAADIKPLVDEELSVNIALDDVVTVCERRGMVSNSMNIGVIVNANSEKQELAATFMRFIASTEAGTLFAKEAKTQSPFSFKEEMPSTEPWFDGVESILSNPYYKQLRNSQNGFKADCGITSYFPTLNHIFVIDINEDNISKYDKDLKIIASNDVYKTAANALCDKMMTDAKAKLDNGDWKPVTK